MSESHDRVMQEMAKAIVQLAQEVYVLNSGIIYDFDLDMIAAIADHGGTE